jgi:hypothetical protein
MQETEIFHHNKTVESDECNLDAFYFSEMKHITVASGSLVSWSSHVNVIWHELIRCRTQQDVRVTDMT